MRLNENVISNLRSLSLTKEQQKAIETELRKQSTFDIQNTEDIERADIKISNVGKTFGAIVISGGAAYLFTDDSGSKLAIDSTGKTIPEIKFSKKLIDGADDFLFFGKDDGSRGELRRRRSNARWDGGDEQYLTYEKRKKILTDRGIDRVIKNLPNYLREIVDDFEDTWEHFISNGPNEVDVDKLKEISDKFYDIKSLLSDASRESPTFSEKRKQELVDKYGEERGLELWYKEFLKGLAAVAGVTSKAENKARKFTKLSY